MSAVPTQNTRKRRTKTQTRIHEFLHATIANLPPHPPSPLRYLQPGILSKYNRLQYREELYGRPTPPPAADDDDGVVHWQHYHCSTRMLEKYTTNAAPTYEFDVHVYGANTLAVYADFKRHIWRIQLFTQKQQARGPHWTAVLDGASAFDGHIEHTRSPLDRHARPGQRLLAYHVRRYVKSVDTHIDVCSARDCDGKNIKYSVVTCTRRPPSPIGDVPVPAPLLVMATAIDAQLREDRWIRYPDDAARVRVENAIADQQRRHKRGRTATSSSSS